VIASSFEIDEALQLVPLPPESAAAAVEGPDARVWLDLADAEPAELEAWLDRVGVTDLARRLCLDARDRPGFYPLKREIFLVIPILADANGSPKPDYVALLCKDNLLLTLHRGTVLDPRRLAALQQSQSWLPARSIAGLVSALMIHTSLAFLRHTTDLRDTVLAFEERMDREPGAVDADELLDMRSDLISLGAAVADQLPSVQALSATDKAFFQLEDAREYMNCALVNLRAVDGTVEWLDGRIGALRAAFQMNAQEQTNRRLNMLTILTAIFNPAMLLAGIWGMNFVAMPELAYPFGYPVALGVMLLIGILMYLFFRRGGWFD
jgi:magnesium transporter